MRVPEALAAHLAQWNAGKGIAPAVWITLTGHFYEFVGFSRLIWPEFVELDGRVFLADFLDVPRLHSMLSGGTSQRDAQAFMNALDVSGIFGESQADMSNGDVRTIAALLQETWSAKLALNFPGRSVRVLIDDNLGEPGVGELLLSVADDEA
jgi:hypothetical protein